MAYVIVDIETTGLSRHFNKITEIAAARIVDGEIKREFQTLVNPRERIPRFITNLTGIDNELVKHAPTIQGVMPAFVKFLGSHVFVAHNATLDFGFLSHNARHRMENDRLCTRKLANRLLPDLHSKRLGVVCEHLKVKNIQAHRAMGDVHATVDVFNTFLRMLEDRGIEETRDILKFERSSRRHLQ